MLISNTLNATAVSVHRANLLPVDHTCLQVAKKEENAKREKNQKHLRGVEELPETGEAFGGQEEEEEEEPGEKVDTAVEQEVEVPYMEAVVPSLHLLSPNPNPPFMVVKAAKDIPV